MRLTFKIYYIFLLLLSTVTVFGQMRQDIKNSRVREDGFYYYDNGIDTIAVIPEGTEMHLEMIKLMQDKGYLPQDLTLTHNDSVAKSTDGSTNIHCFAFFNGNTGTGYGTIHREDTFITDLISTINRRKAIASNVDTNTVAWDNIYRFDRTSLMSDMVYIDDTFLSFTMGKNDDDLERNYRCILRGDTLNVKMGIPTMPGYVIWERDYVFVPFSNIPADLVRRKRK